MHIVSASCLSYLYKRWANNQPGPSDLVVCGPRSYNIMAKTNPNINTPHSLTFKTMITRILSYNTWTRRKPLISAITGLNLEHQRVNSCKVMQVCIKLYETGVYIHQSHLCCYQLWCYRFLMKVSLLIDDRLFQIVYGGMVHEYLGSIID